MKCLKRAYDALSSNIKRLRRSSKSKINNSLQDSLSDEEALEQLQKDDEVLDKMWKRLQELKGESPNVPKIPGAPDWEFVFKAHLLRTGVRIRWDG